MTLMLTGFATSVVACGGEVPEIATETAEIGSGSGFTQVGWTANNTPNLSTTRTQDCINTFGTDSFAAGIRGFRDTGSADNFVARMGLQCWTYDDIPNHMIPDVDHPYRNVFSGPNFLAGGDESETPAAWDHVARGVRLKLSSGGNYVKDIGIISTVVTSNGTVNADHFRGWTTGYGGNNTVDLVCGEDRAMRGISVRFSTNNGKLRVVSVRCQGLSLP